jgi:uncharacterized membrane protein
MLEYLDRSHILDKIYNIPSSLIIEIIFITVLINIIFSSIYYQIYKYDKESFMELQEKLNGNRELNFFDFFYFSNTTFFSLGYDISPKTTISRSICIVHLMIGFLISTVFIAKIIS